MRTSLQRPRKLRVRARKVSPPLAADKEPGAGERLNRFLARSGVASRREADRQVLEGQVTVNGRIVLDPGTRVSPETDAVKIQGRKVCRPPLFSYYLVYKPYGVLSTMADPRGRPCLGDMLAKVAGRPVPAGRLDYDAEGLVLCTTDGELINRMLHPRYGVKRVYEVKVGGVPDPRDLKKLETGVLLDGRRSLPARVTLLRRAERNSWLRIILREGRNRQVKRMFEVVGFRVLKLRRIAFGPLLLEGMHAGQVRRLRPDEIQRLRRLCEDLDKGVSRLYHSPHARRIAG
jgi:pseudouridine synthase